MICAPVKAGLAFGFVIPFSIPQGICSNANQAAVYAQARQEELGTAAGLLRTSQYVGAIVAASLLGLVFGKHSTDHGMHSLAWVIVVTSAALLIATVMDRALLKTNTQAKLQCRVVATKSII